jgi:uncharacterized protein (DUF3084 family)
MFKKLKGLFVVEDNTPEKTINSAKTTKKITSTSSKGNTIVKTSTTTPRTVTSTDTKGEVNDKFLKILFDALEQNNLEGFDYLEFKKSLQSLSTMPMDEATRFKSAFAMASSMSVSAKQLLDSADFYINILTQEEQKFEKALAQQKSTKVHSQEEQVKQLEMNVKAKAEQITKLTQEIDKLQQQVTSTNTEITKQMSKVAKTKNDFMASYDTVTGQIQDDVANMKKYLIGETKEKPTEK